MLPDTGRQVLHPSFYSMENRAVDREIVAEKLAPAGAMVTADDQVGSGIDGRPSVSSGEK